MARLAEHTYVRNTVFLCAFGPVDIRNAIGHGSRRGGLECRMGIKFICVGGDITFGVSVMAISAFRSQR